MKYIYDYDTINIIYFSVSNMVGRLGTNFWRNIEYINYCSIVIKFKLKSLLNQWSINNLAKTRLQYPWDYDNNDEIVWTHILNTILGTQRSKTISFKNKQIFFNENIKYERRLISHVNVPVFTSHKHTGWPWQKHTSHTHLILTTLYLYKLYI